MSGPGDRSASDLHRRDGVQRQQAFDIVDAARQRPPGCMVHLVNMVSVIRLRMKAGLHCGIQDYGADGRPSLPGRQAREARMIGGTSNVMFAGFWKSVARPGTDALGLYCNRHLHVGVPSAPPPAVVVPHHGMDDALWINYSIWLALQNRYWPR
jgi:hypothetical protein